MGKPLTISGLSRESGVNLETIRFYERSELLPPPRRSASGYRHYEEADIRRVRFIRRGRELGADSRPAEDEKGAEQARRLYQRRGRALPVAGGPGQPRLLCR